MNCKPCVHSKLLRKPSIKVAGQRHLYRFNWGFFCVPADLLCEKKSCSVVRSRKNETISNEPDSQLEPGLYCKSHPDCTACYRRLRSQTRPLPLAVSSTNHRFLQIPKLFLQIHLFLLQMLKGWVLYIPYTTFFYPKKSQIFSNFEMTVLRAPLTDFKFPKTVNTFIF